jgi:hypothetical protein
MMIVRDEHKAVGAVRAFRESHGVSPVHLPGKPAAVIPKIASASMQGPEKFLDNSACLILRLSIEEIGERGRAAVARRAHV